MTESTDWLSALAILAAGLMLGVVFVMAFNRRKHAAPAGADLERNDLLARKDSLIEELRELDESSTERARLERETADVLRRIDELPPSRAATPPREAMNPTVKGFIWGAASTSALVALGWFVMQSMDPREEDGAMTGGIEAASAPAADPQIAKLEAAVQSSPDNLQLRNELAQAYLEANNLMGVFEQTKYVLAKTPNDSRALTFQALVRMAMGEGENAMSMLHQATRVDPANVDAWVALAWFHVQQGQMTEAETMIGQAIRNSPADRQRLEGLFSQMKAQLPGAGQQQAMPPRAVRVSLELDPAARSKKGVLFVLARPMSGGPPVAVKRVDAASFPLTVELGPEDSMMGQPLPDRFRVEARLDSDGNATTKPPTDPSAMLDDVAVGAVIKLALK